MVRLFRWLRYFFNPLEDTRKEVPCGQRGGVSRDVEDAGVVVIGVMEVAESRGDEQWLSGGSRGSGEWE